MKKRYMLALLICMLFLASCASPLRKSLVNEEMPKFVGYITPITIQIQPEYQPVNNINVNILVAYDLNFTLNSVSSKKNHSIDEIEFSLNSISNVKKHGDMLTWNTKVIEMTTNNNESLKPNIPIADYTLLTDKYGDIIESEISLPFFEQPHVRSKFGEKNLSKIKKEMKEMSKFSGTLPNTPIITGNNFTNTALIKSLSESESPFWYLFSLIVPKEPAKIVKGWGYFNGNKVLVSTVDFVFEKIVEGKTARIIINGYELTNPDNFMPVHTEIFLKAVILGIPRNEAVLYWRAFKINREIPTDPFTSADISIRERHTLSSKLKN